MLRLICGDFGVGKTTKLYKSIQERAEKRERSFLLVPEQMTVQVEEAAISLLPESAPLFFEVSNFSRLANTVFRKHGGLSYRYASAGTRALVMWRTLSDLSAFLKAGRERPDIGEVRRMLSAISELRAASVTAKDLTAAVRRVENGKLQDTLHDLSLIFPYYHERLAEGHDDALSDLDRLADILSDSPIFDGAEVYIDGFTSFTEQQYRVFAELIQKCNVTVAIGISAEYEKTLSGEEVAEFRRRLLTAADKCGIPVTEEWLTGNRRTASPMLKEVSARLWLSNYQAKDAPPPADDGALRIVESRDPFEAADFVAADILARVRAGARFRDFAILCADAGVYAGILDTALEKSGIPAFTSTKVDIMSFELVKMIFSAYAILQNGWRQGDIISYLKCRIPGVPLSDIDRFESYVDRWQVRGKRYTDPRDFAMHPAGYTGKELTAREREILAAVNRVKHTLTAQMERLAPSAEHTLTVRAHATVLYEFLRDLGAEEKTLALAEGARADGRVADADCLTRLFPILCNSLTELCETVGEVEMGADGFLDLLRILFSELSVGKIPSSVDEVTIGGAADLRADGVRHIYLFGVNEGEFPAAVSAGGIFSEEERAELEQLGLPLHPELYRRASRELYVFSRAFSAPSESVTCIYTLADAALAATAPARAIARMLEISGLSPIVCADRPLSERIQSPAAALDAVASEGGADAATLCEVLATLPEYKDRLAAVKTPLVDPRERISREEIGAQFKGRLNLTQSRMESYVRCPFSYFCQYVLRLGEERRAKFDYANVGNFVHALLEGFFKNLAAEGKGIRDLSLSECYARVDSLADEYIASIAQGVDLTPRLLRLIERLKRATNAVILSLYEEYGQCQFVPTFFELPINYEKGNPSPIDISLEDGTKLRLFGTIDRVDVLRKENRVYLRVIDYKTGKKSFSRADIAEGQGLQMPLYLFSLTESGAEFKEALGAPDAELVPAGVLYLSTRAGDKSASTPNDAEIEECIRGGLLRSGLLLEDEEILRAMDAELSGKYIPVKMNKDGSYSKASQERLIPLSEMDGLLAEIKGAICKIAGGIAEGIADATPAEKSASLICQSCKMKAVCRNVHS